MSPLHDELNWLADRFDELSEAFGLERNTRPEHDAEDAAERQRARDTLARVKAILERTAE